MCPLNYHCPIKHHLTWLLLIVFGREVLIGSHEDNSNAKTATNDGKSGGINKTTLAAIMSIFSAVLIICLMAVYFHKPERR